MPNPVSPGVYVIEKDISEYAPTLKSSVVGVVGFASKGPVNEATLITDSEKLTRAFGKPSENIPGQAIEGAVEMLETTDALYFVRAAGATAADASASVQLGGCPVVLVSANGYGVTNDLYLKVQVTDNAGTDQFTVIKEYSIPTGTVGATGNQSQALISVIGNGSIDSSKLGAFVYAGDQDQVTLVGTWAGSGSTLSVSSYSDAAFTTGIPVLRHFDARGANAAPIASSVVASGTTIAATGASSLVYHTQTIHPGTGYNLGTTTAGATSGNSIEIDALGGHNFRLTVNEDGVLEETFKASLVGSGVFIEDVINTGEVNLKSDIIKGYLTSGGEDFIASAITDYNLTLNFLGVTSIVGAGPGYYGGSDEVKPRCVKPIAATTGLAGGVDGFSSDSDEQAVALIGDNATNPKTGMQALDDDVLNIGLAIVPGIHTQAVQNALITLAENTQNFLAVVAPPRGAVDTVQEAIDWSNGLSETRTAALNSSYAAMYWPHIKIFDVFTGEDKWMDPGIYGVRQMAFTDNEAETWFAPAGWIRGRLTKPVEVEVKLNQGDRDSMYSGGNVINPIVNFPQRGIAIFGQRTTQRDPTALDRINVRRLMIFLRKILLAATQRFVFEPNDPITWERIQGVLVPLLDDIQDRRGIVEYKVICDETTNTPARIDRNELWCKILLKPTKTAEMIIFEINLTNQSAKLGA